MQTQEFMGHLKALQHQGLGTPLLLVVMLSMMVLPLPPMALDVLFTFNIAIALMVILVVLYTHRPLDFAAFPTVLLVATLLRLSLNVASTRVVLLEGHNGGDAAGKVIQAFGEFVVGGNYAVGLIVFAIITIINFVVVTKGAGRISEVSARFTLDAMPGKQMAVDADLNAGLITQDQARARREEIASEADFYGAMDGASKFVRGDAIAGILILLINVIGGLAIGMAQHGLDFSQAAHNYALLTIGDGLVAQIPSLVLSTAAAIIVTRVTAARDMGQQIADQLLSNPKALLITAIIVGVLGLVPGMPNLVFLLLAGLLAGGAWLLQKKQLMPEAEATEVDQPEAMEGKEAELSWEEVAQVDTVGLEVGYRLIPLLDKAQGGQLMNRIRGVRRKLSQELGFLVPAVHIRDNLELAPGAYRITLMGVPIGEAEVYPDMELAINPGQVYGVLKGIDTVDPAFGLEAVWIDSSLKDEAQTLGYTVVDTSTVIATHLSHLLQQHAHELLGYEEVQQLLDILKQHSPKLVEDLVPKLLPLGTVLKVLQNLLWEGIPIRDMRTIAETLAEYGRDSQNADTLTAAVRRALSRQIFQKINGMKQEIKVITLDPNLEHILQQAVQGAQNGGMGMEPGIMDRLMTDMKEIVQEREMNGETAVLLVSPSLRPLLSRLLRSSLPSLNVVSYEEIPDNKQIMVTAHVGRQLEQAV
ncbi:flagellar biosynthesis protein FlhA [Thiolapillus brandeum]|uniref:Flagellar biosynthesis protein FlhA n=1 Tax=Thiolapillus brandeum TaxID=1076588 RepID=A0A7U6GIL4_9GAMM|nr:flagellar biosynthesis protein FlhA [Thiolapillus brandeum]BAO44321.1 flagellar biosynthesis protein FlhA [Thiolapillus brandeum]